MRSHSRSSNVTPAQSDGGGNEVFCLGTGHGISVREVIEASRVVTNREVPVIIGFLALVGLVSAEFLSKYRRQAIVVNGALVRLQ